jgi:hypothetical protein
VDTPDGHHMHIKGTEIEHALSNVVRTQTGDKWTISLDAGNANGVSVCRLRMRQKL